jgi:hypothetical protein
MAIRVTAAPEKRVTAASMLFAVVPTAAIRDPFGQPNAVGVIPRTETAMSGFEWRGRFRPEPWINHASHARCAARFLNQL